jgi:LuxR family maltose regulon positive regulatory protein
MDSHPRLPGKLTAPFGAGLIARPRLFEHLDRAAQRGVAWVCAPAGAGKTSLLSTWLEARRRFPLWYRIDPDDNDPATFVHYLARMAAALAPEARPLPPLTPEYLLGLETFARRFFRDFYDALHKPFVLVLDDFHLIAADSPTMALVNAALAELPPGSVAVLSGRNLPPPVLTRWVVRGSVIEWDDLRLDIAETEALLGQMNSARTWDVAGINAQAQGWAAGLVLVARAAGHAPLPQPISHGAAESLSDYFRQELLAGVDAARRDVLLATALLPTFTAEQARALSGYDDAGEILETLRRENFFIVRLGDTPPSYQYHPLFLAFLRQQGQDALTPETLNRLRGLAAQLAEKTGQYDAAMQLYRDAQAWPQSTALICRLGPELMAQGRYATMARWIGALPEDVVAASAWLLYWLGTAQIYVDPERATGALEQAYAAFQQAGVRDGALLACAGILESVYLRWDDFTPALDWVPRLDALLPEDLRTLSLPLAARVLTVLPLLVMARHDQPPVRRLVEFAEALLADPQAVAVHGFTVGAVLYRVISGDPVKAQALMDAVIASPGYGDWPPVAHIHLLGLSAFCAWMNARPLDAYGYVERALTLGAETGIYLFDSIVLFQGIFAALTAGDTTRAGAWLERAQQSLRPGCRINHDQFRYLRTLHKLSMGDAVGARLDSQIGVETCIRLNVRSAGESTYWVALGWSLALSGEARRACELMHADVERARATGLGLTELWSRVAYSYALFAAGEDDAARKELAIAFGLGRSHGRFVISPVFLPRELGRLCAEALQAGIEPDYVRRLVRMHGIPPPSPDFEAWPWPVHVYTLGGFALHKADVPVRFSGKAQKKPLQLLKVLIALGSRGAAASVLAEVLWEDSAEGTTRHSLDMAISRLRKLLDYEDAILVQEGKVSLNDKVVWVDARAFESIAVRCDALERDEEMDVAREAIARYSGPFLAGEEEATWPLACRNRLRSRYLRLVSAYGAALERAGQWKQAAESYRQALELEPLAEEIYQRLMHCHLEQGEHAQALEAFRRCRDMLSIVLGLAPSPQTETLASQARAPTTQSRNP